MLGLSSLSLFHCPPPPLRGAGPDPPLFSLCSVIVGLELELSTKFRESFPSIQIIDGRS